MNKKAGKMKSRVLCTMLSLLLTIGMIPPTAIGIHADPVTQQNVKVDAAASGEVNGPWTLTFTAQQTRAPQGGEVNFGTDAEIRISLASVLDSEGAKVTLSPNDKGATATLSNKQLVVTGYNYGDNIGAPLTITVSGVKVDSWSLDQNNNIAAGTETTMDAISGTKWFKTEGSSVEFPVPTVKVMKLAAAKPAWSGKTVSWEAVTGADGYKVTYMGGSTDTKNIDTTETSIDLTDYIDQDGRYTVSIRSKRGGHVATTPGSADKQFYKITATPSYKNNPNDKTYQAGTDGGTVSGSSTATGTTFSDMTEGADSDYMPGGIKAFVGVGDEITITATPATGYTGKLYQGNDEVTSPYTVTIESAQYHSFDARFDIIPPDPVTVILEVGKGHEAFAKKISDAAAGKCYEPTISGTTLTLTKFPVIDEYGETVTVQDGANNVIYELVRTAFGPGFGYWQDNGEELIDTALKTIENYDSEEAIWEELDAATDAIANNQKYYLLWAEPVSKVDLTIEKPICGTKVKQDPDEDVFENGPVVTASDDSDVVIGQFANYWVGEDGMAPITEMDIKGGEDYTALEALKPKFGFFLSSENLPAVTVENADSIDTSELESGVLFATVTADHDLGEWEPKEDDPTKEVQKCKHCGEVINERDLITVTLIPSTMDGSKVGDPVVLTIPKGESLDSYTSAEDGRYDALVEQFENMNEGYYPYCWGDVYVTDKPYSQYSSEDDVDDADDKFFYEALTENTTFYVPMDKFIDELDVTVERPMAGTQVAVETSRGSVKDGAKGLPTTTISDDKVANNYELPYWVTDDITKKDYDKPFNGTIQAREDYKVLIQLEAKLGWAFKKLDDPTYVTINGKAVDTVLYSGRYLHDILGTVPSDFTYNLYVGGVHVTDSNKDDVLGDGTVKFDPENVKLTLNNADIEISRREDGDDGNEYGIRSNLGQGMEEFKEKPLTIELIGTNTISDGTNDEGTAEKYGIFVASSGPVTYTGGGTLNVNMKDANTAQRYLGLEHRQSITVDGVDISIDIDGTVDDINGVYMRYNNTFSLKNGSNVLIDVTKGYAFDNNVQGNQDLSVAKGCTFEATSGGANGALHGNNWVQLTDDTKKLGVFVNTNAEPAETLWDGTTNFAKYKYVKIPGAATLKLHWSSIDGEDLMPAVEIPLTKATALADAIKAAGYSESKLPFEKEGYVPAKIFVPEKMDSYSNYDELFEAELVTVEPAIKIDKDTDLYFPMFKAIDEAEASIEVPACGTTTSTEKDQEDPSRWNWKSQTNPPKVSTPDGALYVPDTTDGYLPAYWCESSSGTDPFIGTFEGGKSYSVNLCLAAKYGYWFTEKTASTINGIDATVMDSSAGLLDLMASIPVKHEPGEWEPKEGDPAKEVQKCKHCGEVINERDLITVTLIPSAYDGSEVGDPIVLTVPKGMSLDEYLDDDKYDALVEQFENMNEGYYPYWGDVYVTDKPYSEYSSEDDVDDADDEFYYKALTEDTTFYVPMDKFIEELDVTVERPMAGTQVAVQTDDGSVQDGAKGLPTTTISDDKVAQHCELPYWVTDDITKDDYDKPFNGTIQAREDYKVLIQLEAKLGWAFKKLDDPAYATINGQAVDAVLYSGHYYHDILGTVPSGFYENTKGDGNVWTKGSGVTSDFTFKRSVEDEVTFERFRGIRVDGKDVAQGNYKASAGSVVIKLNANYLETLSVGDHVLTAVFADGEASAKFKIQAKSSGSNTKPLTPISDKTAKAPATGDAAQPILWLAMLIAASIMLYSMLRRRQER